jgi:hypothetical protein
MANPVTYNSGSNPSGALKSGTVSMSVAPSLDITGYNWRNGFDSNSMWTIYSDTYSQGLSTQGNSLPTIWSTPQFTEQGLIDLINVLPARAGLSKFTTLSSAITWLTGEGKYFISNQNYPQMITNGLQFFVDAGLTASYPQVNSSWYELSGSLTGQLNNTPTWANYKTKSYFIFDGTDDWTNFSNNTNLNSNTITVSSWFNPDAVAQNGFLFEKGYVNTQYALFFEGSGFKLRFMFDNLPYSDFQITGSDYMTAGRWYNATVTYDGSVAKMYINGTNVLTTTYNGTISVNNNGERIGSWYNGSTTGYHFDGAIAKTLVYNRALTNNEVLTNYYQGNIINSNLKIALDPANIISYPSTGTNWYDMSPTKLSGTLSNGPTYNSGFGGYLSFDGTDDFATFGSPSSLFNPATSTMTIMGWIYIKNPQTNILIGLQESGAGSLSLGTDSSNYVRFIVRPTAGSQGNITSTTALQSNTWYHIAMTKDTTNSISNCSLYINGVLDVTSSSGVNFPTSTSDIRVGVYLDSLTYSNINVGNIQVYDTALTNSQIRDNYAAYQDQYKSYFPYANGGTTTNVTIDGINYRVHTFTTSGTLTVVESGFAEVLVIAGGGPGGGQGFNDGSGGGGAGGLVFNSAFELTAGNSMSVVIGGGGAGVSAATKGQNGSNSVLGSITAIGGGAGGSEADAASRYGSSGGSGGGAGGYAESYTGGNGTTYQGNKGGDNNFSFAIPNNLGGGGGGGAGAPGQPGSTNSGNNRGFGGSGLPYSMPSTTTYYAGGGGCGGGYGGPGGTGGAGGGGNGGSSASGQATGTSGSANTGGGGGGAGGSNLGGAGNSGSGGSGIIIVRYIVP